MLKSNRERYFFTDDLDTVHQLIKSFAQEHDGEPEDGLRTLAIYRFADPTGGKRFLSTAIKESDDESEVNGNVTLRWRDEPDGRFHQLAETIEESLNKNLNVLTLAEARKRRNDQENTN